MSARGAGRARATAAAHARSAVAGASRPAAIRALGGSARGGFPLACLALNCFALACLALGGAPAARAAPAGTSDRIVARDLDVPRAGVVRWAVPPELPPADGFAVLGPGGEVVAWRLLTLGGDPWRAARVVSVEEEPAGWRLLVDAGDPAPRHQGLRLPLEKPGLVRLELQASADGESFQPLASAPLFRLGGDGALRGSAVSYPPTDARFVRVRWPAAAGFPRLEGVELETVPTAAERVRVENDCSADGERATVCELALGPGRPLRNIEVELTSGGAVGWRLRRAAGGAWVLAGEGTWEARDAGVARRLPVAAGDGPLRIELWGEREPPQVRELALLAEPLVLEIDAPIAGRYELRSGPGLARPRPRAAAATGATLAAGAPRPLAGGWLDGDREAASDAANDSDGEALLAGELPAASFRHSWPVQTAARPGELVRLELTPEVIAALARDARDLRLARDERQVPYFLYTPDAPGRAATVTATPSPAEPSPAERVSRYPLRLPPGGPGELMVRGDARPLARRVRLRLPAPGAGPAPPPLPTPWTPWDCRPEPPLPCELALSLPVGLAAGAELAMEVDDGDEAPLPRLVVELWRPRRELRFRWPGGAVDLLAGAEVTAPSYDLAAQATVLLAQPAAAATLGPARADRGSQRWLRWGLLGSLGLAAALLLLVLARTLRTPAGGETAGP